MSHLSFAQHHSHADTACLKERSLCEPVPILAEGEFDRIRRRCVLDQCSVLHQRGEAALIAIFKSFASFFGIDRQFKTHDVHRDVFDRVGIINKCNEAGRGRCLSDAHCIRDTLHGWLPIRINEVFVLGSGHKAALRHSDGTVRPSGGRQHQIEMDAEHIARTKVPFRPL